MAAPRRKTAAKAEAVKEVKAEISAEAKEVKTEAPQAEGKVSVKKEAPKTEEKAPVKKAAPKKAAAKEAEVNVFVQYMGREISAKALAEEARNTYIQAGHKAEDIQCIDIYVKPEENAAYYAVNGTGCEEYKIQL